MIRTLIVKRLMINIENTPSVSSVTSRFHTLYHNRRFQIRCKFCYSIRCHFEWQELYLLMEFVGCHYTRMYRGSSQFYCLDMALFLDIVRVTETRRLPFFSKRKKNINSSRLDPGRREKINLNFYFQTSLWYLKRFYEGLKCLHKTFWGTTKKSENKNLS